MSASTAIKGRRPRLVFVINSVGSGGAERALETILRAGGERLDRYDLQLVLLDRAPEMRAFPEFAARHCLDAGGRLPISVMRLRRLLGQLQPDLVIGFLVRANVAVAFSGGRWHRILCERMHLTSHLAGRYSGWRLRVIRGLLRLAYRRATWIFGVSKGVTDDLIAGFGAAPARCRTINNPYDIKAILAGGNARPSIAVPDAFFVAVGRLVAAKGFADLVAAYDRADPDLPLLILGEGPERPALVAQIAVAGLEERILMPGFIADPWAVVSRARGLISASYNEGFPNAIAEAMVLGTPVLATDCPAGPAELLGRAAGTAGSVVVAPAGLVVPMGDVTALATGITMLADRSLCDRLSREAARRMTAFRVELIGETYWQAFDQAVSG